MVLFKEDKEKKEKITYVRCDCGTHGFSLMRMTDFNDKPLDEIFFAMYVDTFYAKQYSFFKKWKDKLYKMWCILIGKSYLIEHDLVLSKSDIHDLIDALQKIEKDDFNESK